MSFSHCPTFGSVSDIWAWEPTLKWTPIFASFLHHPQSRPMRLFSWCIECFARGNLVLVRRFNQLCQQGKVSPSVCQLPLAALENRFPQRISHPRKYKKHVPVFVRLCPELLQGLLCERMHRDERSARKLSSINTHARIAGGTVAVCPTLFSNVSTCLWKQLQQENTGS